MKVTVWGLNPGRDDIFGTCPDWLLGLPRLLHILYRVSFPGVRQPECGVEHSPVSSVEVKERRALKHYSFSGLSWSVLG